MFDLSQFALILGQCFVICNLSNKSCHIGTKLGCQVGLGEPGILNGIVKHGSGD
jgi:hypothetical protein